MPCNIRRTLQALAGGARHEPTSCATRAPGRAGPMPPTLGPSRPLFSGGDARARNVATNGSGIRRCHPEDGHGSPGTPPEGGGWQLRAPRWQRATPRLPVHPALRFAVGAHPRASAGPDPPCPPTTLRLRRTCPQSPKNRPSWCEVKYPSRRGRPRFGAGRTGVTSGRTSAAASCFQSASVLRSRPRIAAAARA